VKSPPLFRTGRPVKGQSPYSPRRSFRRFVHAAAQNVRSCITGTIRGFSLTLYKHGRSCCHFDVLPGSRPLPGNGSLSLGPNRNRCAGLVGFFSSRRRARHNERGLLSRHIHSTFLVNAVFRIRAPMLRLPNGHLYYSHGTRRKSDWHDRTTSTARSGARRDCRTRRKFPSHPGKIHTLTRGIIFQQRCKSARHGEKSYHAL